MGRQPEALGSEGRSALNTTGFVNRNADDYAIHRAALHRRRQPDDKVASLRVALSLLESMT